MTIFGDVEEDIAVEVYPLSPGYPTLYIETIYPFDGEKTVYFDMGFGSDFVPAGDFKLIINSMPFGEVVYYEKSFTLGGSGCSIVQYSPSVLTSWSQEMSFAVSNHGDFPSRCTGGMGICVEVLYEGQWDNLVISCPVDEGPFELVPGDYEQFHINVYIDETWRDQLKGQTRDVWLVGIGTTRPRFTLTFPSS